MVNKILVSTLLVFVAVANTQAQNDNHNASERSLFISSHFPTHSTFTFQRPPRPVFPTHTMNNRPVSIPLVFSPSSNYNQLFMSSEESDESLNVNQLSSEDECGTGHAQKIFGGKNTDLDEYPWIVLLKKRDTNGRVSLPCAGVIINKRYILTAAHCLNTPAKPSEDELIAVRVGEWNLKSNPDCVLYPGGNRACADIPKDIPIAESIPHPDFDTDLNNDIGLIRLANDIEYTDYVKPICIPSANLNTQPGEQVMVAGWGRTETNRPSSIKKKLGMNIADRELCINQLRRIGQVVSESHICAGGEYMQDTCDGDSGGPLMVQEDGKWSVEGIVSYGYKCGQDGWPGIYTRVNSYLDWMRSNMRN